VELVLMALTTTLVPVLRHFLEINVKKQMNVSPVRVRTVELAWTESTILPVFVHACSLENAVKVKPEYHVKISWT